MSNGTNVISWFNNCNGSNVIMKRYNKQTIIKTYKKNTSKLAIFI